MTVIDSIPAYKKLVMKRLNYTNCRLKWSHIPFAIKKEMWNRRHRYDIWGSMTFEGGSLLLRVAFTKTLFKQKKRVGCNRTITSTSTNTKRRVGVGDAKKDSQRILQRKSLPFYQYIRIVSMLFTSFSFWIWNFLLII